MLHTPFDPDRLQEEIQVVKPSWLARARDRTERNQTAGMHVADDNIWSEIKEIFTTHQHKKCAYCERWLGSAAVEWDVEHFRPKAGVDGWASPTAAGVSTGDADTRAYFGLALEPRNYLVACKPCNTIYKRNFFPIAGVRMADAVDIDHVRAERPYLLNPLDPDDEAPEDLIGFRGVNPRCVTDSVEGRRRAEFTIEVLGLSRADLDLERSRTVMHMWIALQLRQDPDTREDSEIAVHTMTAIGSPHASCARCFQELFESDRDEANRIGRLASRFVLSHSS
jgi:hypothetical protein